MPQRMNARARFRCSGTRRIGIPSKFAYIRGAGLRGASGAYATRGPIETRSGAVPGRSRGSGHMAPTYNCRDPAGSTASTAFAALHSPFGPEEVPPAIAVACRAHQGREEGVACANARTACPSRCRARTAACGRTGRSESRFCRATPAGDRISVLFHGRRARHRTAAAAAARARVPTVPAGDAGQGGAAACSAPGRLAMT